jgi:hypothetical protein
MAGVWKEKTNVGREAGATDYGIGQNFIAIPPIPAKNAEMDGARKSITKGKNF